MKDRVPTKPNRYAVYDDAHNFLRYEYHERADAPASGDEGDSLNVANLLPAATCDLLGIPRTSVPKDALNAIPGLFLYQKIRDIADTSATDSLSLDISDIDWSVWREIRFIANIGSSTADTVLLRMNNLSGANYKYTRISTSTATVSNSTSGTSAYGAYTLAHAGLLSVAPLIMDVSITKELIASNQRFCYTFNKLMGDTGDSSFVIGSYAADIATLTSLNLVLYTAGYTISIADASLWGARR